MSKQQVEQFMDEAGKRLLGRDSMVLFLQEKVISHVGVVVRRDKQEISHDPNFLVVGVNLVKGSVVQFLEQIQFGYSKNNIKPASKIRGCTHLFQVSCSSHMYCTILDNLISSEFDLLSGIVIFVLI